MGLVQLLHMHNYQECLDPVTTVNVPKELFHFTIVLDFDGFVIYLNGDQTAFIPETRHLVNPGHVCMPCRHPLVSQVDCTCDTDKILLLEAVYYWKVKMEKLEQCILPVAQSNTRCECLCGCYVSDKVSLACLLWLFTDLCCEGGNFCGIYSGTKWYQEI